jgi:hypothetical protein
MQAQRMTWGAAGRNANTYHIALVGQHSGTVNNIQANQIEAACQRIAAFFRLRGWAPTTANLNRIVRHRDLAGQATACNNFNLAQIRTRVSNILAPQPKVLTERFRLNNDVRGFSNAANASTGTNPTTTVKRGNLFVFSRSNGMVNVRANNTNSPGSWINPAHDVAPNPRPTISRLEFTTGGNLQLTATGTVSATLRWATTNATRVTVTSTRGNGFTNITNANGTHTVTFSAPPASVAGSRTLTMTAHGPGGTVTRTVTLNVLAPVAPRALRVGDRANIASNATWYGTRNSVPASHRTNLFVRSINGNRIVVSTLASGDVSGAVHLRYLTRR